MTPEIWDILKILIGGYAIFLLNRSDRNQRELFRRLRSLELTCAAQHGVGVHVHRRESDSENT